MGFKSKKRDSRKLIVGNGTWLGTTLVAILVGAIVIALGWASAHQEATSAEPAVTGPTTTVNQMATPVAAFSGTSQGSPEAPITIVEYSDFLCPHCQSFAITIKPRLDSAYIQTGKVRFVYKHLISYGEKAQLVAEAAECAAEQDRFWQFYSALMYLRLSPGTPNLTVEKLGGTAGLMGLDVALFHESLTSRKFQAKVQQDDQEGRSLGFTGIPAFFINGVKADDKVVGSFEKFQEVLDAALRKLGE